MNIQQIVLSTRPTGTPTSDNFKFESVPLPAVQMEELLLQPIFFSVDPYMRGRMKDAKSYIPPFELNKPIESGALAKVLESKSPAFKAGDVVTGMLPWRTQTVSPARDVKKVDANGVPATYFLGILGMPGLTAYFGFLDIGKPKKDETVVVSGAAGAVGLIVGQLAKMNGCHVVGIVGSDEKASLLKADFGYDEVINYKTTADMRASVRQACPKGVDIYFDNVGGAISDAVIGNINFHARIPLCGQISLYNISEIPIGPRLQPMLLTRSVLMQGFIVSNYKDRFPEGIQHLTEWVKEGKLKFKETVVQGFDRLPTALLGLFSGDNTGKMIVAV